MQKKIEKNTSIQQRRYNFIFCKVKLHTNWQVCLRKLKDYNFSKKKLSLKVYKKKCLRVILFAIYSKQHIFKILYTDALIWKFPKIVSDKRLVNLCIPHSQIGCILWNVSWVGCINPALNSFLSIYDWCGLKAINTVVKM